MPDYLSIVSEIVAGEGGVAQAAADVEEPLTSVRTVCRVPIREVEGSLPSAGRLHRFDEDRDIGSSSTCS